MKATNPTKKVVYLQFIDVGSRFRPPCATRPIPIQPETEIIMDNKHLKVLKTYPLENETDEITYF